MHGLPKYDKHTWQSYFANNVNAQDNVYISIAVSSKNKVYLGFLYFVGFFFTIINDKIEVIEYTPVFDIVIDCNNMVWVSTPFGLKNKMATTILI